MWARELRSRVCCCGFAYTQTQAHTDRTRQDTKANTMLGLHIVLRMQTCDVRRAAENRNSILYERRRLRRLERVQRISHVINCRQLFNVEWSLMVGKRGRFVGGHAFAFHPPPADVELSVLWNACRASAR